MAGESLILNYFGSSQAFRFVKYMEGLRLISLVQICGSEIPRIWEPPTLSHSAGNHSLSESY